MPPILLICLSQFAIVNLAFASSPLDFYRIGKDTSAVYKFSNEKEAQMDILPFRFRYRFDAILRSGAEPNEILFELDNIRYMHDLKSQNLADMAALSLPFAVKIGDDFQWSNLKTNSNETAISLTQKKNLLDLMISIQIPIDETYKPGVMVSETNSSLFGDVCKVRTELSQVGDKFLVEMRQERNKCTGPSKIQFQQNEIFKGNIESEIYLDMNPMRLIKAKQRTRIGLLASTVMLVKNSKSVEFVETRSITETFDWSVLDRLETTKRSYY